MIRKALITLLIAVFLVVVAVPFAYAGDKQLTFQWEQTLVPDFDSWKLYMSEVSGGPYTQFGAKIVYDGTPSPNYSISKVLTSPDGQEKTYYFVVNAWDDKGNFSADSNEASAVIDFLAPGVPVTLTVTVQAAPPPP